MTRSLLPKSSAVGRLERNLYSAVALQPPDFWFLSFFLFTPIPSIFASFGNEQTCQSTLLSSDSDLAFALTRVSALTQSYASIGACIR